MDLTKIDDLAGQAEALFKAGHDAQAEALLRDALAIDPRALRAWALLAGVLLVQGRYREGWTAFEARYSRCASPLHRLSYPEWTGAPLGGRSVLVCSEQGLGDEVMYARFLPELRRLGAGSITLACREASVRAFQQLGVDRIVARDAGPVEVPKHDCWVLIGSLPHRLGVTLETLSSAAYLAAEPRRRGGVAIVERGNPENPNDSARSIHDGLLRRALPEAEVLEPKGDLQESLERVADLDLLVTVDTSWAHIAGALGVPCWLILSAHGQDWRWLRGRRDSPWYKSMRIYRQETAGDWSGVIAAIRSDLLRVAKSPMAAGTPGNTGSSMIRTPTP